MGDYISFKDFLVVLLKGIMQALGAELVDFYILEETVTYGVRPEERKTEVIELHELEIPSHIFINGRTIYGKRKLAFFLKFYVRFRGVELESIEVYDTDTGTKPPLEGENCVIKACKTFLELVKDVILKK